MLLAVPPYVHTFFSPHLATAMAQHDVTVNLSHFFSKPFGINMSAISPLSTCEAFHATVGCPSRIATLTEPRFFVGRFFCPPKNSPKVCLLRQIWMRLVFFFFFFFGPTMKVAGKFHLLDFFLVSIPANTVG